MNRLDELLAGGGDNYILPFLWMHGEPHEVIREEIGRIAACGIRALCVESRPHPDFAGPGWWSDLDVVMDEARRRAMRVWVLDDNRFPTGHASGAFETAHADKAKLYLAERHMDVIGPARDIAVLVQPFLTPDASLLAVLAARRPDLDTADVDLDDVIDLTGTLRDGFVRFDVPAGAYRVFVLFTTRTGGGRPHYMNLIDAASVRVLIDTVYEPHYARYRADFGGTFAGFFSDEPELGNTSGYDFHDGLGQPGVRLPWSGALASRLRALWGNKFGEYLIALWYGAGAGTHGIRYDYMNEATRLVRDCLAGQLGAWCEERGVAYIGHIIEDDNAHGRLGCSVGHFFRAQAGQHMSGIDVVHHQITPGFTGRVHRWVGWQDDGEFFHFGLAKLAASAARIDPNKQGRALCEIFGNYGWAEGVGLMKWLTDHMLVRGINRFVPHAFSPTFPDRDCPPHFYARGHNPQYRFFQVLMRYMNRVAHLLSGGESGAGAAVLYHAEAEWSGRAMLFQKPVRALMEAQLPCDVLPCDALTEQTARIGSGRLLVNGHEYACLIVPDCERIPAEAAEWIIQAAGQGLRVLFADGMPDQDCHGNALPEGFGTCGRVVPLDGLAGAARDALRPAITVEPALPGLRLMCAGNGEEMVCMFFNESVADTAEATVRVPRGVYHSIVWYDAANNRARAHALLGDAFQIALAPGEAALAVLRPEKADVLPMPIAQETHPLHANWRVSACTVEAYPDFAPRLTIPAGEPFPNLTGAGEEPPLSGVFRYEADFDAEADAAASRPVQLRFSILSDAAEVWINGGHAGFVLGGSGSVDISGLLREGANALRVEVASTLVWAMKDPVSVFTAIPPTGLGEPPVLVYEKQTTKGARA